MKFPKVRHALLSRILVYVIVLGLGAVLPITVMCLLPFVPLGVKVTFACFVVPVLLLVYLFRNFAVLMGLDMLLALARCRLQARKSFALPGGRRGTPQAIDRRIRRFGRKREPIASSYRPETVRYRSQASMTIFFKSIEKVLLTYRVPYLDRETLRHISDSVRVNTHACVGTKKHLLLDKNQKDAPLAVASVAVIHAARIDEDLRGKLFDLLSKQNGDGQERSRLLCVVDEERGRVIFDSETLPYMGMGGYPVKNRAYTMIRKYVFGGHISRRGNSEVPAFHAKDCDLDTSLWELWRHLKRKFVGESRRSKRIFQNLHDDEVVWDGEKVYYRISNCALSLWIEKNEETRTVTVEKPDSWSYPKVRQMSKKHIAQTEQKVRAFFDAQGYEVVFDDDPVDLDE